MALKVLVLLSCSFNRLSIGRGSAVFELVLIPSCLNKSVDASKRLEVLNNDKSIYYLFDIINQLIKSKFCFELIFEFLSPEQKKLEDKFKSENFDLINWFIISNK